MRFANSKTRITITTISVVVIAAIVLSTGWFLTNRADAASPLVSLANSVSGVGNAQPIGIHNGSDRLSIEFTLTPQHPDQLQTLLSNLYNPSSPSYHQWLKTGDFAARFAPSASQRLSLTSYLHQKGLAAIATTSPFTVKATGTTQQIETAFQTQIIDYKNANGKTFFSNNSPVRLPASLASLVTGVAGLSNTALSHSRYITTAAASKALGLTAKPNYGAGPLGSGLTPSQLSGLYSADSVHASGPRGSGAGKTLAVFELSGYNRSDIATYEHQFFGIGQNTPLVDVNVDGGPIHPLCPTGDICVPAPDYSGDIEVEADIETQIAMAPKINGILVYNAPNDFFGITSIDEYLQIAQDNLADSISSSWGLCELDAGFAQAAGENLAFLQMSAQGQSMFASSGDTGAFGCLRGSGRTDLDPGDPSQETVTVVGGTSFGTYNPGTTADPSYPTGFETVWNPLGRCRILASGAISMYCGLFGASGGGVSRFWAAPSWQYGPGVQTTFSQRGAYCGQTTERLCREVPDVSANADEFTPYAEYCTGVASTNSACLGSTWFGIGGTSLSSPLWSAIVAIRDSYQNSRVGLTNYKIYELFNDPGSYSTDLHDISGVNQTPAANGFYPVTPNYDMGTGVGTPRVTGIAKDL